MKNTRTRISVFALAVLLLAMSIYVPLNKAAAATTYNNTANADLTCSISSNGRLTSNLSVTGIKGTTTRIQAELYVEKRFLLVFWSRVAIGYPNDLWTDSVNSYNYSNTFWTDLSSTGTYRVTVTYTVSGTGGADDIITKTQTQTY